jgi:hypothetical protein
LTTAAKPKTDQTLAKPAVADAAEIQKVMRTAAMRIGIPIAVVWIVVILIGHKVGFAIAGLLTAVAAGIVGWAWWQMRKSKKVAGILRGADTRTAEGRRQAIEQLEQGASKGDTTALFAKAQILMHEDPRKALEVLEGIKLDKALGPVADEARGQRAMIHLLLGEVDRARALVDAIDLSRHESVKSRASLGAVVAEAWARSGQAKRAGDTLDLFDPDSKELEEIRPQLWRARAFAAAAQSDTKRMKHALRKLRAVDPKLLGGFLHKKIHPLLEREAKQMLMQSGAVPKKMQRQRM